MRRISRTLLVSSIVALLLPARSADAQFTEFSSDEYGASVLPQAVHGSWSPAVLPSPMPPPGQRSRHSMVYDPRRHRMVAYGGVLVGSTLGDVWEFSLGELRVWKPMGGGAGSRRSHGAVYDSKRDRMIVFGGSSDAHPRSGQLNDVRALSFETGAWGQLQPAGVPPAPRDESAVVYDSVGDRLIVFGGYTSSGMRNDVWELTLSSDPTWRELSPTGELPMRRFEAGAVYDSVSNRMIVYGGDDGNNYRGDVWQLELSEPPVWTQLHPAGGSPGLRTEHAMVYDPIRRRAIVYGGLDPPTRYNDTWTLSLASPTPTWQLVEPSHGIPSRRHSHAAAYDPLANQIVIFGGVDGTAVRNDVWAFSLGADLVWARHETPTQIPSPRVDHAAFYDPSRRQMLTLGGMMGSTNLDREIWTLNLDEAWFWRPYELFVGSSPQGTYELSAAYDAIRDRVLALDNPVGGSHVAVWALYPSPSYAWVKLYPFGEPPNRREDVTVIYDSTEDRLLYLGGWTGTAALGEVWALTLRQSMSWVRLEPDGPAMPARRGAAGVYDPQGHRIVIYGGRDGTLGYSDTWVLELQGTPRWRRLAAFAPQGQPRWDHSAIFDPLRRRMVIFGGSDASGPRNDTWELALGELPRWLKLEPGGALPPRRARHTAIYDPVGDQMVVQAGLGDGQTLGDLWILRWAGASASSASPPAGKVPNSIDGPDLRVATRPGSGVLLHAVLAGSGPALLEVFDLRGRRVWRHPLDDGRAGEHEIRWPAAASAGPGVYFARLRQSGREAATKFVLVR